MWDEIEALVHRSYLSKYVRSAKIIECRPPIEETFDDHNQSTTGVINIISGVLPGTDDPFRPISQEIENWRCYFIF